MTWTSSDQPIWCCFSLPLKGRSLWITPFGWVILGSQHISSASVGLCGKAKRCLSSSGTHLSLHLLMQQIKSQGIPDLAACRWLKGWHWSSWVGFLLRCSGSVPQDGAVSQEGGRAQGKHRVICNSTKHWQLFSSLNNKTGFHSNFAQANHSWQNF